MSEDVDEIIAWLDDRAERCRQVPEWSEGAVAYEQRAAALRRLTARCDAYREALKKYGRHLGYCAENKWPAKGKPFAACDCGFEAALALKDKPT